MTLVIATVTAAAGWVSQDSAVYDLGALPNCAAFKPTVSADAADAWASLQPDGTRRARAEPVAFMNKLFAIPRLKMVIAGTGNALAFWHWCAAVSGMFAAGCIRDVDTIAPEAWRRLDPKVKAAGALVAFHLGYDRYHGRVVGRVYNTAEGWRGVPVTAGHSMTPMPAPDDPEYEKIESMWGAAGCGQLVEEFHVKVAEAQHRTGQRGRYMDGMCVGGQLHTALVDSTGIHLSVTHQFPDYEAQLERLYDGSKLA